MTTLHDQDQVAPASAETTPSAGSLRRRIVVATADTLSDQMAGPGIRALRMAQTLSVEHDVRLVTTGHADLRDQRFGIGSVDERGLQQAMDWCEIFVFQGWILAGRPQLSRAQKVLVADIYDPMHLEQLELGHEALFRNGRWRAVAGTTLVITEQLLRGDFFLCASSRQRDFWIGHLAALGRVNPATYDEDAALHALIAVAPFGIDDPPAERRGAVKGVIPGIGSNDRVIVWGGGLYNWFDPLTLIRAVDRLRRRLPDVRLLFMGLRHPNPDVPTMRMAYAARQLSEELELTDRFVFFNESWVPFEERAGILLDADVGVSTHLHHVETEFSFRTRILDYLWAELPVVATGGDAMGELVEERSLGLTVPPGDVEALEKALERLLDDAAFVDQCRQNIGALLPELRWPVVLRPLLEFCRHPRRAPDLIDPDRSIHLATMIPGARRTGLRADVRLAIGYMREGGPALVAQRMRSRMAHKRNRSRTEEADQPSVSDLRRQPAPNER